MMTVSKLVGRWGTVCGLVLVGSVLSGGKSQAASDSRFLDLPGLAGTPSRAATNAGAASSTGAAPATATSRSAIGAPVAATESIDWLKVGDTLVITFADLPVIIPPLEVKIREDGTVTLLENLTFTAAPRKRGDLEKEIHEKYVPSYYKKMTVTVGVKPMTQFYSVGGFVKQPGRQVYVDRIRLLAAIQSCGDFSDFGDVHNVQLIRDGRTMIIDAKKARRDSRLNVEIYPGDIINVPKRPIWRF